MPLRPVIAISILLVAQPVIAGVAASRWQLQNPTPLMAAAQKGEITTVNELLANGSDVNEQREGGATPLIFAASRGQVEIVRLLLAKGADPTLCAEDQVCPLWYATRSGSYGTIKALIDAGATAAVNPAINALEHPALHLAAAGSRVDIVILLLDHGAQIDFSNYFFGNTALAVAVRMGNVEMARLLIERGANLGEVTEIPYHNGKSALEIAKKEGHSEVVRLVSSALGTGKYNQPKYS